MSHLLRKMLAQRGLLMEEDKGNGNTNGGGSAPNGSEGGSDGGEAAARAAADKAAAEAEAAKKNANLTEDQKREMQRLADEKADLLREVMDKKQKLKDTSEKLSQAEQKLKDFEGLDATEMRKMLKERQDKERDELEKKGQWDALKSQMAAEHKREREELEGKLNVKNDETASLLKQIGELTVGSAFNASEYIKEDLILTPSKTRALYGSHFEYVDGKVVGYDKPAGAANRTVLVDAKGDALSFEAALHKLVDADPEKDSILRSKSKPGSGSTSQVHGKNHAPELHAGQRTSAQKISAGLAKMKG